ncbi:MAG: bifunctional (p)ppGpp synthetase/guanosine-3',5'-bis(diphosphate) 3'-pyrophosphohydrolase, partial [Armatimonadota bacterium]
VIDLPAGSTPVDFAYRIHTEVGNQCVGAKVNGRIVPLNYVFRNGDVTEILTSSRPDARPSLDWLAFAASSQAKSRIKAWYRRAQREESIGRGRERLEEECQRLGVDPGELLAEKKLEELAHRLSYSTAEDLYAAVGYGDLAGETVIRRLRGEPTKPKRKRRAARQEQGSLRMAISAGGVTDVLFRLSRCCAPVPGDAIVGFVTRGRGVTVHRADCRNVPYYSRREPSRLVPLEWTLTEDAYFPVEVDVYALDRVGLMSDITSIISERKTNILQAQVRTGGKPKMARFSLTLEVKDLDHLKGIMDRIAALSDVVRVDRAR